MSNIHGLLNLWICFAVNLYCFKLTIFLPFNKFTCNFSFSNKWDLLTLFCLRQHVINSLMMHLFHMWISVVIQLYFSSWQTGWQWHNYNHSWQHWQWLGSSSSRARHSWFWHWQLWVGSPSSWSPRSRLSDASWLDWEEGLRGKGAVDRQGLGCHQKTRRSAEAVQQCFGCTQTVIQGHIGQF